MKFFTVWLLYLSLVVGLIVESSAKSTVDDRFEVWCYSSPGCVPCATAKRELEAAKADLKFVAVWKDDPPVWLNDTPKPAFWCHRSAKQPSQKDVANTFQLHGWPGLKAFAARIEANREKPQ